VRKKIGDVVAAAQQRQLDVLTVSAGTSERGAETLMTFAARNAGSALGEKALLNAFMAAKDQQDTAQLIKIGDQLLRDYPKSSEIVTVLGTLGKLTAQSAQFDEAARYLEEAARRETAAARGQELERTAAVLRAQRGDRKGAEDGLKLLQGAAAPMPLQLDVAQALGELYRKIGDQAALVELVRAYPQAPAQLRMDALQAQLAGGAPLDRFAGELKALAGAGGDVGAEARLLLADLARLQLEAIAFGPNRKDDAKIIGRRFAVMNQVEAQYLAVVKLQQPQQVLEALGRLALLYQGGAQFLESAPVPAGLAPADAEKYQAAFRDRAKPMAKKAEDAVRTCGETAQQLRVFSAVAKACVAGKAPPLQEPPSATVAPRPAQPEAPALRSRLVKNPGDGDALVQLALLHLKAGDLYGAKLVADRAVEASSGAAAAAAKNVAGVVAYQLGEPQEAYRAFQEALKADKRNPRVRLNLGVLYREYGYGKLIATELGGLADIPADLLRDAAVLPGASLSGDGPAQEKK
jgi:cellulose synthase operon protein C